MSEKRIIVSGMSFSLKEVGGGRKWVKITGNEGEINGIGGDRYSAREINISTQGRDKRSRTIRRCTRKGGDAGLETQRGRGSECSEARVR